MRVLFLNPPAGRGELYMKELGRCGRRSVAGELWPQTGLAYLAAVVIDEGGEALIIDAMAQGLLLDDVVDKCLTWRPDVAIVETTTPTFAYDCTAIQRIRAALPDTLIGLCGTHSSALPDESLRSSSADFVIINEAEETVREIVRHEVLDLSVLSGINGIAHKSSSGAIEQTPERSLIMNLDELPFPARHLLPNERYTMPFFEDEPFVTIIPSRGCPYPCIFCRAGKVWGRHVRTRSPESVCAEIRQCISSVGIRNIVFMTDSLTLKPEWTQRLCHDFIERDLDIRWICNSRVDAVDFETLALMKRAGCELISYGVESGNQKILDRAKKGITLEQAKTAIGMTKKAGITTMAYFVIGLPGETHDTIEQSIRFAREIGTDHVNFHVATPFPGTEFYEMARENGWLISDNWSDFEQEGSAVISTDDLSANDLLVAQRKAMRAFYLNPRTILRQLSSIRSPKQFKSHLKAGIKVIGSLFRKQKQE